MKKTIAAVAFAAAMAIGSTPSFAAFSGGQITAFDFNTVGNAIVAGGGANFANVNNSSFTLVSANEYAKDLGMHGSSSGASSFGIQRQTVNMTAVSGGLAGGASWRGGSTAGSLTVANLINN
ncbi:MAG: hypothetical protein HGB02_00225 [Chlorobiaceae bacterium]|nr:hypothetical protein [Chlorobiaceae bacterium]